MVYVIYTMGTRRMEAPMKQGGDYLRSDDGKFTFFSKLNAHESIVCETYGPGGYFCEETWVPLQNLPANVPVELESLNLISKRTIEAAV